MAGSKFLKVAKQAAVEAGKVVMSFYGKKQKLYRKGSASDFATQADLESEKEILQILTKNFPDHNILSEEKGFLRKDSPYTWVVDPLDGTINFVAGLPFFSISIGLVKNGRLTLGVINRVVASELYWAQVGKGAFLNGKRIQISKQKVLDQAVLGLEYGHTGTRVGENQKVHLPLLEKLRYPFTFGGAAATMALVANGLLDGYIHSAYPWDFAAGSVLVEEAGGKVTDFSGKPLDWSKDWLELVATNGMIHEVILTGLKTKNS